MIELRRGEYVVCDDPSRLDITLIHGFLKNSYWAADRTVEVVQRSVDNSLNFGVYGEGEQVGYARVLTDHATVAHLSDVFILEAHRGRGLGRWLVEVVLSHPDLAGLAWRLTTENAHELYRRYGFEEIERPEKLMERRPLR
ncbi:MAG: GNAT family N-acetyltransferase [Rubrobacteraceae bacterium]